VTSEYSLKKIQKSFDRFHVGTLTCVYLELNLYRKESVVRYSRFDEANKVVVAYSSIIASRNVL
jgi:hypothetical protein